MIDEIKRSVRSGKIMGAVICTIISLLFLLLFIFELRGYLAPTYNLDEIDEFNIKAGMKVRGEVDLNFGPYCYMEEENRDTGETTIKSEEYYIPLETAIIGMECEDEYQIHQMDYNYGLVESYLDGDIDDLEELEDSFMTLSVEGYIRKLSGESLQYYNEIIYVFLTIFLYLLKCPQSLILSALRAFCFCGKSHIPRSIFLYFRYQSWLKSW